MISKTIAIKDLPEGYFKERLTELCIDTSPVVIVVAMDGQIGDWAAYIGWPTFAAIKPEHRNNDIAYYCFTTGEAEMVAMYGDKLSRDEAIHIFPKLLEKVYRL
jgi:hypothetical protein